eukprot:TRINITY_DN1452_c0_g1_i2.p1 TRINITY_DN1452_c0_g1~~TRINITY_DN1452_c0_g1_i2.p1  ORF type:complete len:1266 (-),score=245.70 TRINITY_DN1452_c0_g1_i2:24-3821(-)
MTDTGGGFIMPRSSFGLGAMPTSSLFGASAGAATSSAFGGGSCQSSPFALGGTSGSGGGGGFGFGSGAGGLFGGSSGSGCSGLFGSSTSPSPGGGLFGSAPSGAGGKADGPEPSEKKTLFGGSSGSGCSGLFGSSTSPSPGGGLFGSAPSGAGGKADGPEPSEKKTLFGGSSGSGCSGLFGSSTSPSPEGGVFGSAPSGAGGKADGPEPSEKKTLFGGSSSSGGAELFGSANTGSSGGCLFGSVSALQASGSAADEKGERAVSSEDKGLFGQSSGLFGGSSGSEIGPFGSASASVGGLFGSTSALQASPFGANEKLQTSCGSSSLFGGTQDSAGGSGGLFGGAATKGDGLFSGKGDSSGGSLFGPAITPQDSPFAVGGSTGGLGGGGLFGFASVSKSGNASGTGGKNAGGGPSESKPAFGEEHASGSGTSGLFGGESASGGGVFSASTLTSSPFADKEISGSGGGGGFFASAGQPSNSTKPFGQSGAFGSGVDAVFGGPRDSGSVDALRSNASATSGKVNDASVSGGGGLFGGLNTAESDGLAGSCGSLQKSPFGATGFGGGGLFATSGADQKNSFGATESSGAGVFGSASPPQKSPFGAGGVGSAIGGLFGGPSGSGGASGVGAAAGNSQRPLVQTGPSGTAKSQSKKEMTNVSARTARVASKAEGGRRGHFCNFVSKHVLELARQQDVEDLSEAFLEKLLSMKGHADEDLFVPVDLSASLMGTTGEHVHDLVEHFGSVEKVVAVVLDAVRGDSIGKKADAHKPMTVKELRGLLVAEEVFANKQIDEELNQPCGGDEFKLRQGGKEQVIVEGTTFLAKPFCWIYASSDPADSASSKIASVEEGTTVTASGPPVQRGDLKMVPVKPKGFVNIDDLKPLKVSANASGNSSSEKAGRDTDVGVQLPRPGKKEVQGIAEQQVSTTKPAAGGSTGGSSSKASEVIVADTVLIAKCTSKVRRRPPCKEQPELGTIEKGSLMIASGPPQMTEGTMMIPLKPEGAVCLRDVEVIVDGSVLVTKYTCSIYESINSLEELGTAEEGISVIASGRPVKAGVKVMVPVKPAGFVDAKALDFQMGKLVRAESWWVNQIFQKWEDRLHTQADRLHKATVDVLKADTEISESGARLQDLFVEQGDLRRRQDAVDHSVRLVLDQQANLSQVLDGLEEALGLQTESRVWPRLRPVAAAHSRGGNKRDVSQHADIVPAELAELDKQVRSVSHEIQTSEAARCTESIGAFANVLNAHSSELDTIQARVDTAQRKILEFSVARV